MSKLTDRIAELERENAEFRAILAELRKPSYGIIRAARFYLPFDTDNWSVEQALDAAVAAARDAARGEK